VDRLDLIDLDGGGKRASGCAVLWSFMSAAPRSCTHTATPATPTTRRAARATSSGIWALRGHFAKSEIDGLKAQIGWRDEHVQFAKHQVEDAKHR
jgi:hypothetical protein